MAVTYNGFKCAYCRYQYGFSKNPHNTDTCTAFKQGLAKGDIYAVKMQNKIESGGKRVCGSCGSLAHNSTKCSDKFNKLKSEVGKEQGELDKAFLWLHEIGFGPGAMLSGMASENYYRSRSKDEKIVVIEEFSNRIASAFFSELINGRERNWFDVKAVDTTNETVRRIYLPYHEFYSPKPTSKKVSVIHRANAEDIEGMKKHLACYSSLVLGYDNAEDFFNAGYKFESGTYKINAPRKQAA